MAWLARNELHIFTELFALLLIGSINYFPSSLLFNTLAPLVRHLRLGFWGKEEIEGHERPF